MIRSALLVLALVLAAPLAAAAAPLAAGDWWRYESPIGESTITVETVEDVTVENTTTTAFRINETRGVNWTLRWERVSDRALVRLHAADATVSPVVWRNTTFETPCPRTGVDLSLGDSWKIDCPLTTRLSSTGAALQARLAADVVVLDDALQIVPAGAFDSIAVEERATDGSGRYTRSWLAPAACGMPVKIETPNATTTLTDYDCSNSVFSLQSATTSFLSPYLGAYGSYIAFLFILAFIVLNFVMAVGGLMSYIMRKVMARIQTRIGPNRVGPFGLLQFLADGIKMASKEDIRPAKADKWAYRLAPFFVLVPLMLAMVPLPFSDGIILIDLPYGLLFILAIGAITPIGELFAGWGSNNKYATYGAIRAASLDISYEIPMIISAVSVMLVAGSLSTQSIVAAQQPLWFVFIQPVGAFIFFVCALAKAGVVPTDLAESESELIAGYFTEYGGMKFGVFQINVFFGVVFIAMLTVLLYFGGWSLPFFTPQGVGAFLPAFAFSPWIAPLAGVIVFLGKTMIFTLLVLLVWFTLPRLRPDQFLTLGWKVLFPLSLLNLVVTAGVVFYLGGL